MTMHTDKARNIDPPTRPAIGQTADYAGSLTMRTDHKVPQSAEEQWTDHNTEKRSLEGLVP